jgi:DNA-directed RNA polymerase II subunit RPB3
LIDINHGLLNSLNGKSQTRILYHNFKRHNTGPEKAAIVESDPSKMFKYDADTDTFTLTSPESCTYDGEVMKKVRFNIRFIYINELLTLTGKRARKAWID